MSRNKLVLTFVMSHLEDTCVIKQKTAQICKYAFVYLLISKNNIF